MSELDQRIIDCLLEGDPEQLDALWRDGGGEAAVRRRASELGLTAGFIRTNRLSRGTVALRTCVCCDVRFLSQGAHNRLCRRCSPK